MVAKDARQRRGNRTKTVARAVLLTVRATIVESTALQLSIAVRGRRELGLASRSLVPTGGSHLWCHCWRNVRSGVPWMTVVLVLASLGRSSLSRELVLREDAMGRGRTALVYHFTRSRWVDWLWFARATAAVHETKVLVPK